MSFVLTVIAAAASSIAADTGGTQRAFEATTALIARYERDHGRFATLNGIRTHWLEWGNPSGTPLVWLHGSASTGYEIRAVAPRLVAAGYRVLAMDYRGHGQTRVTDYDFTIWHVADDVVALLDHLKIDKAVIGGASKGGFIAAAVYDQYKSRVSGLLLADGGSWSNQWIYDHHGPESAARQTRQAPPRIAADSPVEVFGKLVGNVPNDPARLDPERFLDLVTRITQEPGGQWVFLEGFDRLMGSAERFVAGTTAPSRMPLFQWSQHAMVPVAVFRNVAVPVMILDPEEEVDDLPVADQNARLAMLHPKQVIHKRYPDSRHAVIRDKPDWFVRDAIELLARVRQ